jgi:hypothetical protein
MTGLTAGQLTRLLADVDPELPLVVHGEGPLEALIVGHARSERPTVPVAVLSAYRPALTLNEERAGAGHPPLQLGPEYFEDRGTDPLARLEPLPGEQEVQPRREEQDAAMFDDDGGRPTTALEEDTGGAVAAGGDLRGPTSGPDAPVSSALPPAEPPEPHRDPDLPVRRPGRGYRVYSEAEKAAVVRLARASGIRSAHEATGTSEDVIRRWMARGGAGPLPPTPPTPARTGPGDNPLGADPGRMICLSCSGTLKVNPPFGDTERARALRAHFDVNRSCAAMNVRRRHPQRAS